MTAAKGGQMGRARIVSGNDNVKRICVSYRASDIFDSWHYIHKYYLTPEDKGKLFPVDICALDMLSYRQADFEIEGEIDLRHGMIPDKLHTITIFYKDLKLEKVVDAELVRCGLRAISAYRQDKWCELTAEEARAALNLNEWLRCYEKILIAKHNEIEEGLRNDLRVAEPFLVDYEIDLVISFFLHENDLLNDNDDADCNDWDSEVSLMCIMKSICAPTWLNSFQDPDYWGIGDDRDHNDSHGSIPNGISTVARDERSQTANRKRALERLAILVARHEQHLLAKAQKKRWDSHNELVRGNPVRVYEGGKLI